MPYLITIVVLDDNLDGDAAADMADYIDGILHTMIGVAHYSIDSPVMTRGAERNT